MKLLHIGTSGVSCSVILTDNCTTLATRVQNVRHFTHSENLHLLIETITAIAGVPLFSLDAIAVSADADSYTGSRIEVATVEGLYSALGRPLIGVLILQILTCQATTDYTIPMSDARRMEVYSAVFDSEHRLVSPIEAKVLDADSYKEHLNKDKMIFLGGDSTKFATVCQHPSATFITGTFPEARDMIPFAIKKYKVVNFEDIAYFGSTYLK